MPNHLLRDKLSLASASKQVLGIANDLENNQDIQAARLHIKEASTFWEKRLGNKYPSIKLFKDCKAVSKILLVIKLNSVAKELAEESEKISIEGEYAVKVISWVNTNDLMYRYGSDKKAMIKRDSRNDEWKDSSVVSNKDLDQFLIYDVVFPCQWEIIETPVGLSDDEVCEILDAEGWIPEEPTDLDLAYIQENSEEYDDDPLDDLLDSILDSLCTMRDMARSGKFDCQTIKQASHSLFKEKMIDSLVLFGSEMVSQYCQYLGWIVISDIEGTLDNYVSYYQWCIDHLEQLD